MNLRYYSLNNGEQLHLSPAYGSMLTRVPGERAGRTTAAGPPVGRNCNAIALDYSAPDAAGQPGTRDARKQDSTQGFFKRAKNRREENHDR